MVEQAARNPKVQQIVEDVRLLGELQEHVGWRRLYERVKEDRARFMGAIARRLMAGEKVDQREIDFHRGFYYGALWILGHPEEAEKSLERAARQAYLAVELELEERDRID